MSTPSPAGEPDRTPPHRAASHLPVRVSDPGQFDDFDDPELAHLPELMVSDLHFRPQRRTALPIILFIATCLSTFWVGATNWNPGTSFGDPARMWLAICVNWPQGLAYMGAVLAILLAHEMGHFWQTIRHRIPASYPLCIPLPINPFGTMGAVIGMDGLRANRRQIFDIGIAGPLAGLVVAVPIMWLGVSRLAQVAAQPDVPGELYLNSPLIVQWMMQWSHPNWQLSTEWIRVSQVNALFMAGWVGMLITGLNMLPISQLDGGHTIYALFGRDAHGLSRGFLIFAILFVVIYLDQAIVWVPMLVLIILLGIHHPPTADDTVELSAVQKVIGYTSLAIPILCFPLLGFKT